MKKLFKAINITLSILSSDEYMVYVKDKEGNQNSFTNIETPRDQSAAFAEHLRRFNSMNKVYKKFQKEGLIRMN